MWWKKEINQATACWHVHRSPSACHVWQVNQHGLCVGRRLRRAGTINVTVASQPCLHVGNVCFLFCGHDWLTWIWSLILLSVIHTHTRLTALCMGLPRWAGTRRVKPIWILLKLETVSGSGISWATCKSAPCSRQIAMPAPLHSVFYRPDALPAAQPTASKHWRYSHKNPDISWEKQSILLPYLFEDMLIHPTASYCWNLYGPARQQTPCTGDVGAAASDEWRSARLEGVPRGRGKAQWQRLGDVEYRKLVPTSHRPRVLCAGVLARQLTEVQQRRRSCAQLTDNKHLRGEDDNREAQQYNIQKYVTQTYSKVEQRFCRATQAHKVALICVSVALNCQHRVVTQLHRDQKSNPQPLTGKSNTQCDAPQCHPNMIQYNVFISDLWPRQPKTVRPICALA